MGAARFSTTAAAAWLKGGAHRTPLPGNLYIAPSLHRLNHMVHDCYATLWANVTSELDRGLLAWQDRVIDLGQVTAIEARHHGRKWSDQEIFEGIIKAALSNSADWAKVESVLPDLHDLFHNFDLDYYAGLSESDIASHFVLWFTDRKAGSMTLKQSLVGLVAAARKLREYSLRYGSLEDFLYFLLQTTQNDPQQLAWYFGSVSSRYKLPSLGIPIAAEALKNIGLRSQAGSAYQPGHGMLRIG